MNEWTVIEYDSDGYIVATQILRHEDDYHDFCRWYRLFDEETNVQVYSWNLETDEDQRECLYLKWWR